jgi:uncharacterized protein (TIGR03437 family)
VDNDDVVFLPALRALRLNPSEVLLAEIPPPSERIKPMWFPGTATSRGCAARVLLAIACALPAAAQRTFTIQMPIREADIGGSSMGLNSFGAHIGNHGIDGHPGWDIEYVIGASVYAAADGVVQSVTVDTDSGRGGVQIQHSQRFRTDYVGLAELDPAMKVGTEVKAGQRIGLPATNTQMVGTVTKTWASIHFQLDDFTVDYGLTNGFAVSPEAHLDAAGRAVFEALWSRAAYTQEMCEPFPSNPRNVEFPLTRTWTRQSGGLPPRVDFTCRGPLSSIYGYAFFDAAGAVTERGTLEPQSIGPEWTSFDLLPEGGSQRRRGLMRIVSGAMQLDYSAAGAAPPSGLNTASTYRTAGYPLAVTSGASYAAGKIAPESVAAGFGVALAVETASAQGGVPLPTTVAGTRTMVRDSAGVARDAGLYFVVPGQVGFLVPAGTAEGPATVLVTSPDGPVYTAPVEVTRVVPALFSANATGQGVAAAAVQRVRGDSTQSVEAVARYDATQGEWVTVPIDFGAADDQVYLVLYGTGIQLRNALAEVTARVGTYDLPVSFAGAHPNFPGLDQVNVALPRLLAGAGQVSVSLSVAGATSNVVTLTIR